MHIYRYLVLLMVSQKLQSLLPIGQVIEIIDFFLSIYFYKDRYIYMHEYIYRDL
jgi:hypothetical protein